MTMRLTGHLFTSSSQQVVKETKDLKEAQEEYLEDIETFPFGSR